MDNYFKYLPISDYKQAALKHKYSVRGDYKVKRLKETVCIKYNIGEGEV